MPERAALEVASVVLRYSALTSGVFFTCIYTVILRSWNCKTTMVLKMPNLHYLAHLLRVLENLQNLSKKLSCDEDNTLFNAIIEEVVIFSYACKSANTVPNKQSHYYLQERLAELIEILTDARPFFLTMDNDLRITMDDLTKTLMRLLGSFSNG